MQIIVEISDKQYEYYNKLLLNDDILGAHERMIMNGVPIPKKHGRLVDIDNAIKVLKEKDFMKLPCQEHTINTLINELPVILEATEEPGHNENNEKELRTALDNANTNIDSLVNLLVGYMGYYVGEGCCPYTYKGGLEGASQIPRPDTCQDCAQCKEDFYTTLREHLADAFIVKPEVYKED